MGSKPRKPRAKSRQMGRKTSKKAPKNNHFATLMKEDQGHYMNGRESHAQRWQTRGVPDGYK